MPLTLVSTSVVDLRRIRLSPARGHRLADQRLERLVLAGLVLGDDRGVGRKHRGDDFLYRACIGDRSRPRGGDNGIGVAFARPHGVEHLLGYLAEMVPSATRFSNAPYCAAQRALVMLSSDLGQVAQRLHHDPVRREFGVDAG